MRMDTSNCIIHSKLNLQSSTKLTVSHQLYQTTVLIVIISKRREKYY